jgi:hypothetical protein
VTLRKIGIEGLERRIGEMGTKMEAENRPSQTLRAQGWSSIPAAMRRYGSSLHQALQLLGAVTPRQCRKSPAGPS